MIALFLKRPYVFLLLALGFIYGCNNEPTKKTVDLILNSNILNPDFEKFDKKKVIIHEGKIIDIVNGDDIKYKSEVEINSGFVYPGFIDAHCHFWGYAEGLNYVDLRGTKDFDEVLGRLLNEKSKSLVLGRGWNQNEWESKQFPNNAKLNELFPDVPVILVRIDGHAVIVNQKALEISNIDVNSNIEGGIIVKQDGKLTGVLVDNAQDLLKIDRSNHNLTPSLLTAQQNCFEVGLTTLDDAGLNIKEISYLDSLQKAELLKLRLYVMVSDNDKNVDYYLKSGPYKTDRMNVRSFKFYADGALGSRGACLLHSYTDKPNHYGLLLSEREHFKERASLLFKNGFQVNTHAIGDSANRMILNVYKEVLGGLNDKRWRVEHAQVLDSLDYSLFNKYSVLPSVQPTHATSDMLWADERLGDERLKNAYAYKRLLNESGYLPLGTDFPVEGINPINTFYAATVRKNLHGVPENGFQMEDALSRSEAIKGMTIWGAYSNFEESEKGSIEVGKFADFTILDMDLLNCSESSILECDVLFTIINGEVVYKRD